MQLYQFNNAMTLIAYAIALTFIIGLVAEVAFCKTKSTASKIFSNFPKVGVVLGALVLVDIIPAAGLASREPVGQSMALVFVAVALLNFFVREPGRQALWLIGVPLSCSIATGMVSSLVAETLPESYVVVAALTISYICFEAQQLVKATANATDAPLVKGSALD